MSAGKGYFVAPKYVPKLLDPIRFSAAITQNLWYDAFTGLNVAAGAGSKKRNVDINSISFEQLTANEDLEIRIIADDVDETLTQTAVAGTNYFINTVNDPGVATMFQITTIDYWNQHRSKLTTCRSLQIMYRKTTAAGANATTIKSCLGKW